MKRTLLILLAAFFVRTCTKIRLNGDHFIFGLSFSQCEADCARFFLIKKNSLYADEMENGSDKLKFKYNALSDEKFKMAEQLRAGLPAVLKNSASATFGCPDCRDQGSFYIELKENSKMRIFKIDTDTSQVPAEMRPFLLELKRLISEL